MARATARDLLDDPGVELVLADLNLRAAQEVEEGLRRISGAAAAKIRSRGVDAADVDAVRETIRGADVVINAALYYFNLPVMQAALAERVPYLDLGGLFHTTRQQLLLHGVFERAGVTAIVGMGSTPGITNVQVRHAVALLDRVETIAVYCGNTPNADRPGAWGYSINTILDEATKPPMVFRAGRLEELEPLAEPTTWSFLEPIGDKEVHHSLHSEIATLPFSFADRGVRDCFFKINYFGYTPAALRQLKALAEAGLASLDPVAVPDRARTGETAHVRPRDVLVATLAREEERRADADADEGAGDHDTFLVDHEEVAVEVTGTRDTRPTVVRVDTLASGRPDWRLPAGTLLTATPPAIVARWLADASLSLPGVHPPENVVDPERLFGELEQRGIRTTVRITDG